MGSMRTYDERLRVHLELASIFAPDLARPKHAGLWYFINVLKIISDYVCFLRYTCKLSKVAKI